MDSSPNENLPIYVIMGMTGLAFLAYGLLPFYIGQFYATALAAALYFSSAPMMLFMNVFAERDAAKHKVIVGTCFGPWDDQVIRQFKFQTYQTQAIPGSKDNITTVDLTEIVLHPKYGKIRKVMFIHFGTFIGDNLKLGRGSIVHWSLPIDHTATDKLVLYESTFSKEKRGELIPVYKIKHAPKMYDFETGKADRKERERQLEEFAKIPLRFV